LQLYSRLVATVDSENFLTKIKSLQQASVNETGIQFPFKEATGLLSSYTILDFFSFVVL
jgi:hypothetical protein